MEKSNTLILKFHLIVMDNLINMSRNATLCILDNKKEKARHRLPFGSKLKFKGI